MCPSAVDLCICLCFIVAAWYKFDKTLLTVCGSHQEYESGLRERLLHRCFWVSFGKTVWKKCTWV